MRTCWEFRAGPRVLPGPQLSSSRLWENTGSAGGGEGSFVGFHPKLWGKGGVLDSLAFLQLLRFHRLME